MTTKDTQQKNTEEQLKINREIVLDFIGEKKINPSVAKVESREIKNFSSPVIKTINKKIVAKAKKSLKVPLVKLQSKNLSIAKKIKKNKVVLIYSPKTDLQFINTITIGHAFRLLMVVPVFFISLYVVFAILLYSFSPDNKLVRKINYYFPVPAVVSTAGVVDFFTFQDVKNQILISLPIDSQLNSQDIADLTRQQTIKTLLIKSLIGRYPEMLKNSPEEFNNILNKEISSTKNLSLVN